MSGFPSHIRESRFRWFGTDASFEQVTTATYWQDKRGRHGRLRADRHPALDRRRRPVARPRRPRAARRIHLRVRTQCTTRPRCPTSCAECHNGHEGSHHFLVDDFVRAVEDGTLPPVNAWTAARFTLPGVIAHESARRGGERLAVPDFGDAPEHLVAAAETAA